MGNKAEKKRIELEIEKEKNREREREREYEYKIRAENLEEREREIREKERKLKNLNVDFSSMVVKDNRCQIKRYVGEYDHEKNFYKGRMFNYEGNVKNLILPGENFMNGLPYFREKKMLPQGQDDSD
jgi:hypothetical protein